MRIRSGHVLILYMSRISCLVNIFTYSTVEWNCLKNLPIMMTLYTKVLQNGCYSLRDLKSLLYPTKKGSVFTFFQSIDHLSHLFGHQKYSVERGKHTGFGIRSLRKRAIKEPSLFKKSEKVKKKGIRSFVRSFVCSFALLVKSERVNPSSSFFWKRAKERIALCGSFCKE